MATTMTRRPSRVAKSRPNAPYMSFPSGGRFSCCTSACARKPRLATIVNATSASEIFTSWPSPVVFRGEDADHRVEAGGDVPRGKRVVHREQRADRSRGVGDTGRRVHRVVDRGALVGVAHDVDVDEVGATGAQARVGQPARLGEVREEETGVVARCGDELGGELPPLRTREVDGDRALPLVESRPVEAHAVFGDRPALVVETT